MRGAILPARASGRGSPQTFQEEVKMGRGDKRTKRGKIFRGSFGKTRPQGKKKGAKPAKPAATNNA
jgi:30S ribosomal protein S31